MFYTYAPAVASRVMATRKFVASCLLVLTWGDACAQSALKVPTLNPNVIHTFYEPRMDTFERNSDDTENLLMIGAWAEAWRDAGFQTRVLTLYEAEQHPLFKELEEKMSGFRSLVADNPYERLCYYRCLVLLLSSSLLLACSLFFSSPRERDHL